MEHKHIKQLGTSFRIYIDPSNNFKVSTWWNTSIATWKSSIHPLLPSKKPMVSKQTHRALRAVPPNSVSNSAPRSFCSRSFLARICLVVVSRLICQGENTQLYFFVSASGSATLIIQQSEDEMVNSVWTMPYWGDRMPVESEGWSVGDSKFQKHERLLAWAKTCILHI